MVVTNLILIVFTIICSVSGAEQNSYPYCFQFTWLGRTTPSNVNCSERAHTPCIEPFFVTPDDSPPNVTYMWENLNRTAISCPLSPGYACLKYSYTYNDAVLNVTYFCGKMIEDRTLAISNGCYTQKVSGHIVEACACRSGGGMMPCNSSIRAHSSINTLIILTSISMFVYNRLFGTGFAFDIRKFSIYS